MNLLNYGGALAGGATVVLSPSSLAAGRSIFTTPASNRFLPQTVTFITQPVRKDAKGNMEGRAAIQTYLNLNVDAEEGCCSTQSSYVAFDTGIRIGGLATDAQIVEALNYHIALAAGTAFNSLVRYGSIPSS